ncbi:MAG TPA: hypothetical protein VJB96_01210 [Patescibacteria group bacterium]|nr:hypothetical protein [Patescibacteria group bacterium]
MNVIRKYWKTILVFAILFVIFVTNAFHEKYPDEFDSIVGGRYITEGRLPYRDWFQHHQPGAYVMAAAILPFSGQSFVKFRVAWEIVLYALLVGSYFLLKRRLPKRDLSFYVILLFVIGLAGTYFWGHMLLADTLAGYFLLPAFALLFIKDYYKEKFETEDLIIICGFSFLSWFTSMTYIFIIAAISLYALYLFATTNIKSTFFRRLATGVSIVAVPYVLFGLYLLVTGSIADYYWANVVYNTNYYIYNYPHEPGTPINPIRYAAVIANAFINNYLPALWGVAGFPISNPVQVTLAFSSAVAIALAIIRGRWLFLIPLLATLIFSNARSNPQSIRETDYQAFVYIVTSLFNGLFSLWAVREILDEEKQTLSRKVGFSVLYVVLLLYWIATPLYFAMKMEQKFFPKYMGDAPLIYSRPQIAPYVNAIVTPYDYVFIGPFEFEELFYLNAKQPSKYHWFLDHAAKSKIKDELLADLNKNRPKLIVFQRNFAPWGGDASTYNWWMTEFLDREYFRIFTLGGYRWKLGDTLNFDLDGTFNFDKRYQKEIIEKLLSLGYIEPILLK